MMKGFEETKAVSKGRQIMEPLKHEEIETAIEEDCGNKNQASTILYDDEMVEEIINELNRRGHIENEVDNAE
jgi:hypothetical protein